MQRTPAKQQTGILFDAHLGQAIDDILALALLYGADGKNEARIAAVSLTNSNLKAAAFCDVLARIYLHAAWGQAAQFFKPLPVGLADSARLAEESPLVAAALTRVTADGKPVYTQEVKSITDTADPAPLLRNALTAQQDQNAVVVLAGPATNLVRLLDLRGCKELIASKVRLLSVAMGTFPSGPGGSNILDDVKAAQRLFAEWPTPIVAAGSEAGNRALFPGASIAGGIGWLPDHPVADAYRAAHPAPYDAPSTAIAAALYAVRPAAGLFGTSEPGRIEVGGDGSTLFVPAAGGKHHYLSVDPDKREQIAKAYAELVTAKPELRRPRFLQAEDPAKPKPPAAPAPPKPPTD